MDPRRKDEEPGADMMWSSRRVRVPQRPVTPSARPKASPQLTQLSDDEVVIPLLEAKKEAPRRRPTFKAFPKKLPRIPRKAAVALCLLLVIGYVGTHLPKKDDSKAVKDTQTTNGPAVLSRDETPKFATILPAGKSIKDFGGWTRVSPPDREPVFAYVDKIGNIPINVSQQPLPEELKEDTEEDISRLAVDFHAEEKLTVGNTIVHIGTSVKGPQSVIFTKKDLLILIKSAVKIENDRWATYISSLQ